MTQVVETLTIALELLIVPILLVELVRLRRRGSLTRERVKEMATNAVSLLFVVAGAAIGLTFWYWLFDTVADARPWSIPTNAATVIVAVLLADLTYYLEHRFEHEHRLPWDLYHSVHHSSPEYDQTTSLRLGLFDGMLTIGFSLPLVVLGFSPALVIIANGLVIGYQTWIHTEEIRTMPRWFEFVFNTPSHHRAHHGADQQYLDANYGGLLIIWDRLFGTFAPETVRPTYGLTTQIESSHPLDVQFSQLRLLRRDLRGDTWPDRFRRLWNRPGWQPASRATASTVESH